MVNAQEHINKEYSEDGKCLGKFDLENKDKRRDEIFKLNLTRKNLEGELELKGFTDLRVLECDKNKLTKLDIGMCPKLEILNCGNNKLKKLNLDNNKKLILLACWNNEIRNLKVSNCPNLKKLGCSNNQLTELNLKENQKLESLDIADNNFPKQNLSFSAHLTNLQTLIVGNSGKEKDKYNHFTGDLSHLKDMKRLGWLSFDDTKIKDNFNEVFLQEEHSDRAFSVEKINFTFTYRPNAYEIGDVSNHVDGIGLIGDIKSSIFKFNVVKIASTVFNAAKLFRILTEEARDYKIEVAEVIERAEEGVEVKKASEIPNIVLSNLRDRELRKERVEESCKEWRGDYKSVYPNILVKKLNPTKFPKRLYDLKGGNIIETEGKVNKPYATLSYVWNDWMKEKHKEKIGDKEFELSLSSKKSLDKAIEACSHLKIEYLWVDQLCINQDNLAEKAEEVRNMYQNYNNSSVTLISINKNIQEGNSQEWDRDSLKVLEEIVDSDWFTRSWTFQEGWLSKRTIFMFDDMLIDGSFLAKVWAFNQSADAEGKYTSRQEFEEEEKKIATPIGWVHYVHGYKTGYEGKGEDRLIFSLHEALRGVKERRRGVPLDGVYSVLGLLPYGHKVKVEYKKWGDEYTKEDAEKALSEVMKTAVTGGYGEPLAWYGEKSEVEGKSWLPRIKMNDNDKNKNGSAEVWGGINIRCKPKSIYFDDTGAIALYAKMYSISSEKVENIIGVGGKSILGGTYSGQVTIKGDEGVPNKEVKIKVWGTRETLRDIDESKHLILPDGITKNDTPFAILVSREKKESNYRRIGLVGLEERDEKKIKSIKIDSEMIVIDCDKERKNYREIEESYKSQIEQPPKN